MRGKKILTVDDDESTLTLLRVVLEKEGAQVFTAPDGEIALRILYRERPDLLITDLVLPSMSGWELCRRVREMSDLPIIMLTSLEGARQTQRGLAIGADDYITKPFTPLVLIARVEALLRRARTEPDAAAKMYYDDGYLKFDLDARRVWVEEEAIHLTPTEFRLFSMLGQRMGKVCTLAQIAREVWGSVEATSEGAIHTFIWQLRQKLEPDPAMPRYLMTVHGIGYRLENNAH